jgi:hypothetical protein
MITLTTSRLPSTALMILHPGNADGLGVEATIVAISQRDFQYEKVPGLTIKAAYVF